jgi:hypothetical protein
MGGGNWLVLLLVAAGAVRLSGVGASEAGEKAMGQRWMGQRYGSGDQTSISKVWESMFRIASP